MTVGAGRAESSSSPTSLGIYSATSSKRRGNFGRYELLATCDDEQWCRDVLTKIGLV